MHAHDGLRRAVVAAVAIAGAAVLSCLPSAELDASRATQPVVALVLP
jgi:hypothetical protein